MVLLEYIERIAVILALADTVDDDAALSDIIFLKPSCIYSLSLWLLEDDVKAAGNTALYPSAVLPAALTSSSKSQKDKE